MKIKEHKTDLETEVTCQSIISGGWPMADIDLTPDVLKTGIVISAILMTLTILIGVSL